MAQWLYLVNGQQVGPISDGQLRNLASNGQLKPTDFVWRDGLAEWIPAARLQGLFPPQNEFAPAMAIPPVRSALPPNVAQIADVNAAQSERNYRQQPTFAYRASGPFNVNLKSPSGSPKGIYVCNIRPDGLLLKKGSDTINVPLGTQFSYQGKSKLIAMLASGTAAAKPVTINVACGWKSATRFNKRLCGDLASFLRGERAAPVLSQYTMPWYFSVMVLLPLVFTIFAGGVGMIVAGFAILANGWLVQEEKLAPGFRIAGMALVSLAGIIALVLVKAMLYMGANFTNSATQDESQPPTPNSASAVSGPAAPGKKIADPAKLKHIPAFWHTKTRPVNLLSSMRGGKRAANGTIVSTRSQKLESMKRYATPVAFRIVAQISKDNLRIGYAADQIIFNWEMDQDELRVDGGPVDGQHKAGAGRIPTNEWIAIELVVTAKEMKIYIDGNERYRAAGDFSKVNDPLRIWTEGSNVLHVKSIEMTQP